MLICVFIGFSSGLPLWYLIQLIPYWLRTNGVSLMSIGWFAVLLLPYSWKFVAAADARSIRGAGFSEDAGHGCSHRKSLSCS